MKLGVFGGGQLAMMMAEEAFKENQPLHAFLTSTEEPFSSVSSDWSTGRFVAMSQDLAGFIQSQDRILFENEFVSSDAIQSVTEHLEKFFPAIDVLEKVRSKLNQKKTLNSCSIPTAPFVELNSNQALELQLQSLMQKWPDGVVIKWAEFGYDGKGVKVLKPSEGLSNVESFIQDAFQRGVAVYAEQKIAFQSELAMVVARNIRGQFVNYPLVFSEQHHGICQFVYGPATAFGLSKDLEFKAIEYCKKLGEALGIVGVYALEFFLDQHGQLLVNEVAPRVHNTGHYSQDSSNQSQFLMHLRAAKNSDLEQPQVQESFAMVNLIGELDCPLGTKVPQMNLNSDEVLHWYFKRGLKPGRKMGHVNIRHATKDLTLLRKQFQRILSEWKKTQEKFCEKS